MALRDGIFDQVLWHISHHLKDHPEVDVVEQIIFEMATTWPVPCCLSEDDMAILTHAMLGVGPIIKPGIAIHERMDQEMDQAQGRHLFKTDDGTYVGYRQEDNTIRIEWYPPNLDLSWKEQKEERAAS